MSIDILIPLASNGSKHDNIELRFCLRSIEKHLSGVGNIYIIGECPPWVVNVQHISAIDKPGVVNRAENIYSKIITAIKFMDLKLYQTTQDFINNEFTADAWVGLSDNFLFMNDDHFLIKNFRAEDFPYLHRGPVVPHRIGNEAQERQMSETVKQFKFSPVLDYDIHCPIVYNKQLFRQVFEGLEWPEYGYGLKSMYCNTIGVKGEEVEDLKFSEPAMKESIYRVLEGRDWFSVNDKVLRSGGMQDVLAELYPEKSSFEI